jgi:hypothetical protein
MTHVDGAPASTEPLMFKKILIANRGDRAVGAVASATHRLGAGTAGQAGGFNAGDHLV